MDLAIYETHNGGDVSIKGNDLELTNSVFNQPFLALFGANDEETDFNDDWWGNDLFFPEDERPKYNSRFERELDRTALNSAGLRKLESILESDLKYMDELAIITSSISLISVDTIEVSISVTEPDSLIEKSFIFVWNATRNEEIRELTQSSVPQAIDQRLLSAEIKETAGTNLGVYSEEGDLVISFLSPLNAYFNENGDLVIEDELAEQYSFDANGDLIFTE